MRLGFARGIAPSKWAKRWDDSAAQHGWAPIELVPLPVHGRAEPGHAGDAEVDVTLERVGPGGRPAGTDGGDAGAAPTRRAVRLYVEAVALVVPAGHELAEAPTVDWEALALVPLLSHPDHAAGWPEPRLWDDPSWAPRDAAAALDLVATGAGAILLPLPLARHLAGKRMHAVLPVVGAPGEPALPGTEIWASWAIERDDADVQRLVGILRGRTARSGRNSAEAAATAAERKPSARGKSGERSRDRKAGPPQNSRGAQLAAAREKRERRAKRRGR